MKARNPSTGNLETVYVKALDSMPVGTQIEYTGDTVPTGWEEVNDYSTDEVNTGEKWIDGKPIYRKVVSASNIGTAFNTTISNIDNLFFGNKSRISWGFNSGVYPIDRADFYFQKSNNTIQAQNSDVATWSAILVLEYTKTTD